MARHRGNDGHATTATRRIYLWVGRGVGEGFYIEVQGAFARQSFVLRAACLVQFLGEVALTVVLPILIIAGAAASSAISGSAPQGRWDLFPKLLAEIIGRLDPRGRAGVLAICTGMLLLGFWLIVRRRAWLLEGMLATASARFLFALAMLVMAIAIAGGAVLSHQYVFALTGILYLAVGSWVLGYLLLWLSCIVDLITP
jgi:hypothetical protein